MIVTSSVGCADILGKYFNGENFSIHLFTNNLVLQKNMIVTAFVEAVGGGYSAKTLTSGGWTSSIVNEIAQAIYAQQAFTFTGMLTGSPTIYGYYVLNSTGVYIFAERFPAPLTPTGAETPVSVVPRFQMSSGTPTA